MAEENPNLGETLQRVGMGAGLAVGMGTGVALGVSLDNMPVGIGVGIAIGVAVMSGFLAAGVRLRRAQYEAHRAQDDLGVPDADDAGEVDDARDDPDGSSGPTR